MRLLVLTRYGALGASSRLRFYQYLPFLRSRHVEVQVEPLLDDEYIRRLYAGQRTSIFAVSLAYINRLAWLARSGSFDLLWIEKELLPWLPAWAEGRPSRPCPLSQSRICKRPAFRETHNSARLAPEWRTILVRPS